MNDENRGGVYKILKYKNQFYFFAAVVILTFILVAVAKNRFNGVFLNCSNRSFPTKSLVKLMPSNRVLLDFTSPKIPLLEVLSSRRSILINGQVIPPSLTNWPTSNVVKVLDQGPWGSCTAFALRYCYLIWLLRNNKPIYEPSCSFLYYKSRSLIGAAPEDEGSTLAATVSVMRSIGGLPTEDQWPYVAPNIFTNPPSASSFSIAASSELSTSFYKIPRVAANAGEEEWETQSKVFISELLAGKTLLVGFNVFENFSQSNLVAGNFPFPSGCSVGGHAICIIGYQLDPNNIKNNHAFIFFNSWGTYSGFSRDNNGVATGGLFTIPFRYAADYKYSGDWWSL